MIAATIDWRVLGIAAVLLLIAMILLYRLLSRDPDVSRSRYGFFVERDRYEEEKPWPEFPPPPPERTLPSWTDKTVELPPEKEEEEK